MNSDYPKDKYEVIVVLDGKYEPAERFLADFVATHPNVRYVAQEARGPAAARNLGVSLARADILGFIDDDCILGQRWIVSALAAHRDHPEASAIGGITVVKKDKINVCVSQFLSNNAIRTKIKGKDEVIFFPTCNISYRRSLLLEEKFDETFPLPAGEDLEYFWRLFKAGRRFHYCRDMEVIHDRQADLRAFLKQAYMYGRGNYLVQYMHDDHPLLKEIMVGPVSFWFGMLLNIIKIPRFSLILGNKLIAQDGIKGLYPRLSVYSYFTVHKIFYIWGTICEYFRARKDSSIRKKSGTYPAPGLLILDITHTCNLTCRMCDIWKTGKASEDMELGLVKDLMRQAAKMGVPEIALSGGEALVRADIFEIFDHARGLGIKKLGVLTNGIAVNALFDRLVPYLTDGTISLVLSLDSLKPETHDYIRNRQGAWEQTTQSLRKLSELKKRHPAIGYNVITIVLERNLDELVEIYRFVKSIGAETLQFQALLPNNMSMAERKRSEFFVTERQLWRLDRAIDALKELKRGDPAFIKNSEQNLHRIKDYFRGIIPPDSVNCVSADRTVLVSNRGECTTCFTCYGNAHEQDLVNILSGREAERAREQVKKCRWPCLLPCFCDSAR